MKPIFRCLLLISVLTLAVACGRDRAVSHRDGSGGAQRSADAAAQATRTLSAAHPPSGPPEYLGVYRDSGKRVLTWLEFNPGDYNKDGEVGGLDLFPLAAHFNEESNFNGNLATNEGNDCIDGNQDGVLNGMDLFLISVNFQAQVSGFNIYKSKDEGENWELVENSPLMRQAPASFNCRDRGRFDDREGLFEPAWYYVTSLSDDGETDPSQIVIEDPAYVATRTDNLTGNAQVVADGSGFRVTLPAGVAALGDTLELGLNNNMPEMPEVPALGQVHSLKFQVAGVLGGEYTLSIPFLPRDLASATADDVRLMVFDPSTPEDRWQSIESSEYTVVETGANEGCIEYDADAEEMYFAPYFGGDLSATILADVTTGPEPLLVGFSCETQGGEIPYTWDWDFGDGDVAGGVQTSRTFYDGEWDVTCRVIDDAGTEVITEQLRISAADAGIDTQPPEWQTTTGVQLAEAGDTEVTLYWNAAVDAETPPVRYNVYVDTQTPIRFDSGAVKLADVNKEDGGVSFDWKYTVPGLVNDQTYRFSVRAEDSYAPPNGETNTVEAEAVPFAPPQWHLITIDDGPGRIGKGNYVAFDSNDVPGITYTDQTSDVVKYARFNGSAWEREIFDGTTEATTALVYDADNHPVVSYYALATQDLRYATYDGADWTVTDVDETGDVGYASSIAMDLSDNPVISYVDETNDQLKVAWFNGSTWDFQVVDSCRGDDGFGNYTGLAFDSSGLPVVSYQGIDSDLRMAKYNGLTWDISDLDSSGNVGRNSSLALDTGDNPAISYWDQGNNDMKIAWFNGILWDIDVLDSQGGSWTSIAFDSGDNPIISYFNPYYSDDLKVAWYEDVDWTISTVDSVGSTGHMSRIAIDSNDTILISYFDTTEERLRAAWWF